MAQINDEEADKIIAELGELLGLAPSTGIDGQQLVAARQFAKTMAATKAASSVLAALPLSYQLVSLGWLLSSAIVAKGGSLEGARRVHSQFLVDLQTLVDGDIERAGKEAAAKWGAPFPSLKNAARRHGFEREDLHRLIGGLGVALVTHQGYPPAPCDLSAEPVAPASRPQHTEKTARRRGVPPRSRGVATAVMQLHNEGRSVPEIMAALGITRSAVEHFLRGQG